ncbi:hypothetical protein FB451DRAFT_1392515 [Mycena latifolia]|nr:hypothetical protein FB451DRAFT_1392515 [Mycena latifolia]
MSLLRDVLKRNQKASPKPGVTRGSSALGTLSDGTRSSEETLTSSKRSIRSFASSSKRSVKSYPSSIKSSGGLSIRSLAELMMSFYSMMTSGGTRVPKPMITGEVRMVIDKPTNLGSIDVWVTVKSDSVLDLYKPPMVAMTVNVWNRENGDPKSTTRGVPPLKVKFPKGTFVFPFEFPPLPEDTLVKHPDDMKQRNQARLPMPPTYHLSMLTGFSGNIKYTAGINIVFNGFNGIDDEYDMDLQYLPLCKPLPRIRTPFPYIPSREDWPFSWEVVGGWTLTPFGGRGRLSEEMVEVEGILGVQEPAVYTAGQVLEFSLLLWSKNPLALEALGQPAAIDNVLQPQTSSCKNRYLSKLTVGCMWRTDNGRPADDAPIPEIQMVTLPDPPPPSATPPAATLDEKQQYRVKDAPLTALKVEDQQDAKEAQRDDDATTLGDVDGAAPPVDGEAPPNADSTEPAPSPTPSLEDITLGELPDEVPETDHFVRLNGEVRIPACSHPSFRYANMGREYVMHLVISHPQWAHISPNTMGVLAEFPIWYILNHFVHLPPGVAPGVAQTEADLAKLPITGTQILVGPDAIRAPLQVGAYTEERRPTAKFTRYYAF